MTHHDHRTLRVHRWQPTGRAPCGARLGPTTRTFDNCRLIRSGDLDASVTCHRCLLAPTRVSLFPDPRPRSDRP